MQKQKTILSPQDFEHIRLIVREEVIAEVGSQIEAKVGKLPTKDEFTEQMVKLLKAVEDKENKGLVHDNLHSNLGKDTTKLKQQVQHLFKTFEIEDPTSVVASY